ncbi:hypothetical protein EC546_02020 [Helicobacter pylori]|nr:hypothetical protein EC546_02020 [Helicobacter pylori]
MEKILAFLSLAFLFPAFFWGGVTYKLFLDSSKSPILFKLLQFRLLTPLKGGNSCWIKMCY